MKYPTTSSKLQKLAILIQFTLKLICFFLVSSIFIFFLCLFNELSHGGLLIVFIFFIGIPLLNLILSLIWDTNLKNNES